MSAQDGPGKKSKDSDGLDHVKTVLQFAKAGLTGIGIPGVEAIAAVPLEVIAIFETVKANDENLKDLLLRLISLEEAFFAPIREARKRDGFRVPDDIRGRLESLIRAFAKSQETILPFKNLPGWRKIVKRSKITTALKNAAETISEAITIFQASGQVTVELLLHNVHTNVLDIKDDVQNLRKDFQNQDAAAQDREADNILSKLNPQNAGFRSSPKSACLPDTRMDLLRHIYNQLSDSKLSLVCLYGSPGTGKSAVAKTVSATLHAQGLLAASYFFDKRGGDAGNVSLDTFVSTLAYQFAHANPTFRATLVAQLKADPLLSGVLVEERLEKLILEPLRSLPSPRRPFVIILDALDECGNSSHQRRLVKLLRRCVEPPDLHNYITFFLTSRPEVSIRDTLQNDTLSSVTTSLYMDTLNENQTKSDIESFVEDAFRELNKHTSTKSSVPERREVVEFAALAGGLFELAAIRLRQVQIDCEDSHTTLGKALRRVVQTAGPLASGGGLDEVYTTILRAYRSSVRSVPSDQLFGWYRSVVGALASLREPLGITDLAALVGVEEDDARTALRPLHSVVSVPDDGPIRFYHASFLEFLLSDPADYPDHTNFLREYLIRPVPSHTALANRSLAIMNDRLHCNMLNLSDPSVLNADILGLPDVILRHIPGHLQYACLHWAEHLRAEDLSACRDLLVQWCDKNMVFYLEMLSFLGELERAVPQFEIAKDWVNQVDLAPTATLLNDCQRLVQMFYPSISQSSGAIYSSAIPFMPSSPLRERYSHLADGGPVLVRGRLSAWPAQILAADHPSRVFSVAFSPDGRRIASGCGDGLICLLSATTGRIQQLLKGHAGIVSSVVFSPDGARIVSGSDDHTVRIWSAPSGEQERVLEGHTDWVRSVAFSPDGARIVSGSNDCTVRIWSAASGEQEQVLKEHTNDVNSVAFSADSARIVSGSSDRTVRIWFAASGEQERLLKGHAAAVYSVAFSPDGALIVSGSSDLTVRIWFAASGEQERVLEGHTGPVYSVAFCPDGARIVSGSYDRTVRIWSAATGEQEQVPEGHTDWVRSVAFSPDGARIVSGSNDCTVRIWSAASGEQEQVLKEHTNDVNSVAFSADGARIVSGSNDWTVRIWSAASGEQERLLEGHTHPVSLVAFSPDGARIVSGSYDRTVRIWSAASGEQERLLEGHTQPVSSVAFSPDGARIVSGSHDRTVRIWSAVSGEQERVLEGRRTGWVNSAAFSPDGQVIKSMNSDNNTLFWEAETGRRLDQDHSFAQLAFPKEVEAQPLEDGWLRVNGLSVWLPRYIQGDWWLARDMVVMHSAETPGRLAFIRLPSGPGSNRT